MEAEGSSEAVENGPALPGHHELSEIGSTKRRACLLCKGWKCIMARRLAMYIVFTFSVTLHLAYKPAAYLLHLVSQRDQLFKLRWLSYGYGLVAGTASRFL